MIYFVLAVVGLILAVIAYLLSLSQAIGKYGYRYPRELFPELIEKYLGAATNGQEMTIMSGHYEPVLSISRDETSNIYRIEIFGSSAHSIDRINDVAKMSLERMDCTVNSRNLILLKGESRIDEIVRLVEKIDDMFLVEESFIRIRFSYRRNMGISTK